MRHRRVLAVIVLFMLASLPVFASHGWGTYHWPKSCSTCAATLTVYDSTATTNTSWPTHLNRAIFGDASNPNTVNRRGWNDSAALTLSISAGGTDSGTRSACSPVTGAVRVCNYTYGSTGWLGLASINTVSGSTSHIAWGTAKMNDTYFASGYPTTEKRHVMCQEVGHDFGLGHTSTNGTSQNTCMDYYSNTSSTDWTSTGPNQHDFDQILTQMHWGAKVLPDPAYLLVYRFPGDGDLNAPWQWGTPIDFDSNGHAVTYKLDLGTDLMGNERAIWTHVIWADTLDTPEHGNRAPFKIEN
ncbi:MAG TPA: hypothetical protein VHL58_03600 [Thermoanaerobaculia bacterium]|nr:hypothetical protein [Thermoanaerobaculia bacterium]